MKRLSVLIVDDSSVMRKIVEQSVRHAGFDLDRVLEASNGSDALRMSREDGIDLILMDINMPGMDGIEFLRQWRAQNGIPHVPVMMITTEGAERRVLEAIALGARGYLRKPFSEDEVRRQLSELLAS